MAAAIASTQRNEPRPAWLADMLSDVNMREDCRDSLTLAELQAALSIGPSSAMSLAKKNVASGLWRETTKKMPNGHYARAWCKINTVCKTLATCSEVARNLHSKNPGS